MSKYREVLGLFVATSLVCLGGPAIAGGNGAGDQRSWGKSGVSLEQYAADSDQCATAAASMDLSGTAPAQALASMVQLPNGQWGYRNFDYSAMYRLPSRQVHLDRLATIMRHELEQCLAARGYVKFELSHAQRQSLKHLAQGSAERRAYLHSLASDPQVLAAQALTES